MEAHVVGSCSSLQIDRLDRKRAIPRVRRSTRIRCSTLFSLIPILASRSRRRSETREHGSLETVFGRESLGTSSRDSLGDPSRGLGEFILQIIRLQELQGRGLVGYDDEFLVTIPTASECCQSISTRLRNRIRDSIDRQRSGSAQ